MLAAFHLNLTALSWVALLVGLFLVYNTVTISVMARREEIGMLRALGRDPRDRSLALFLGEAAALAGADAPSACGSGAAGATRPSALTATTVSTLYIATAAAPPSLGLAGRRCWRSRSACRCRCSPPPCRRSRPSRVPPTAAMRGADRLESRVSRCAPDTSSTGVGLLLVAAWCLASSGPVDGLPLFGYVVAVASRVRRLAAGAGHHVRLAARPARPARRLSASKACWRTPTSSAAIPRLVDLGRGAGGQPVDDGGDRGDDRQLPRDGGLLGRPDAAGRPVHRPGPARSEPRHAADCLAGARALVRQHPDVAAVDRFRNVDLVYDGNLIVLGAGDFRRRARARARCCSRTRRRPRRDCARDRQDAVVVSEAFAIKHQRPRGRHASRCRRRTVRSRSASLPSTTTTPAIAAWSSWIARTFARYFGELPPTA